MIYTTMAVAAAVGLIWRMKVAHAAAAACAPIGAWFTVAALGTGMLWGKPMWGAYWVWDPRLTAELVLLFLYFGYMGLRAGIEDPRKADKASAVLAIVGVINVPIIKFSVEWWNSLHQTATVMQLGKPTMDWRHVVAAAADVAGVRAVLRRGAAHPAARRTAAARTQCELGARGAGMSEFLDMGGYGKYLWPAFALGFGIVVLNLVLALSSLASAKQEARRRMEMSSMTPRHKRMAAGRRHRRGRRRRGVARHAGIPAATSCSSSTRRRSSAGEAPAGERFRLGGMVEKGSVAEDRRARSTSTSSSRISNTRCR